MIDSKLLDIFKELPFPIKNILVFFFNTPFWYVSMYLFNYDFLNKNSLLTIVMFCYCLVLINSPLIYNSIFSYLKILYKQENIDIIQKKHGISTVTVIAQMIISSILIFIFYSIEKFSNLKIDYYYYIVCHFVSSIAVSLIVSIYNISVKKKIKQSSIESNDEG